jgi:sodium transport system permease protein
MMRVIGVVLGKEFVDALRDRRTIFTIILTALLMGPITLVLLANFISGFEEKALARQIYVDGIERAPELANFLARNSMKVLPAPEHYEDEIRAGRLQDAVLVIGQDFSARLAHGDAPTVTLVFDDTRSNAQPSIRRAEAIVQGFEREVRRLRITARGVSPELLTPLTLARHNTATPKQQGAFLLFLIPMFSLIGAMIGSMSAAIDTTAGERERGSLEPLLTNPIDLPALIIGKWLTVASHSCIVVLGTLCSFAVATRLVPSEKIGTLLQFGTPELLRFCLLMLPFAYMVAALQMLVATYGRTYKEAQTYAGYIALVVNFVPLITVFASIRDANWELFVPALAQQVVLARVLRGDSIGAIDYWLPWATATLITALALWALMRLLRREGIIFGR